MGEKRKRERPPTWREVVEVFLAVEERLEQVLLVQRLPPAARKDIQALLVTQIRPLLRRAAR